MTKLKIQNNEMMKPISNLLFSKALYIFLSLKWLTASGTYTSLSHSDVTKKS